MFAITVRVIVREICNRWQETMIGNLWSVVICGGSRSYMFCGVGSIWVRLQYLVCVSVWYQGRFSTAWDCVRQ